MMRHQYWVTKKTVLSKLGTKEDDCIVSSDAELDAKLELFRSISDSCLQLQRILDQYQERLCILAQEENSLGKFLKDAGKGSDAAGKHMVSAGKAISYSGQQRLSVRGPLLRLYHEVETFRARAVSDMRATVSAMEKARIEYRAALSWMKSASSELDPDTGRGLDNFRKAQRQVRESKKVFDKLTLDVLQKIDLLAAARCNMFSHVLSNYQNSFQTFASKVAETFEMTADGMNTAPQYEFCVLKELGQSLGEGEVERKSEVLPQDKDQMLFFQDEYKDEKPEEIKQANPTEPNQKDKNKPALSTANETGSSNDLIDKTLISLDSEDICLSWELAGLSLGSENGLLQGLSNNLMDNPLPSNMVHNETSPTSQNMTKPAPVPTKMKKEEKSAWFKLFAELDPLANPDNLPGSNANKSHEA